MGTVARVPAGGLRPASGRRRSPSATLSVRLLGAGLLALGGGWAAGVARHAPDGGAGWLLVGLVLAGLGLLLGARVVGGAARGFESATASQQRAIRRLLGRLVETQEAERGALARELHDGPVQMLLASMHALQRAAGDDPAGSVCRREHARLRTVIGDLRRTSRGVRPVTLDALGIERALGRYVEELDSGDGPEIDFQHAGPEHAVRLPEAIELTLYRTAQEALSNVLRHAAANHASVVLVRTREEVRLVVEDDGRGFEPPAVDEESIGLCHMRERAALVGGRCDIVSAPGRGSVVRVRIPLGDSGGVRCRSAS